MKLYTRPRVLVMAQLRAGDQLAYESKTGALIATETAYLDADLAGRVKWTAVHSPRTGPEPGELLHTMGHVEFVPNRPLIVREMIEIDPWDWIAGQRPGGRTGPGAS